MTTQAALPKSLRRFTGPVLIAISTLFMLLWSWGTWPDPLVDFGAQLYVPWRITAGQVLYRDLAYYNGPLSSYFNAGMFRLFGVGISTLVWTNLAILIATVVLVYRLALRGSGPIGATMAGLTFALVFAFGQVVHIGNYNWVTPYTHEITHGTALGLATIAAIGRYQRGGRLRWMLIGGLLLGCVFLTKAEPMAATAVGVVLLMVGGWWCDRDGGRAQIRSMAVLIASAFVAPLLAWSLLSLAMPPTAALRGVLGSWLWVFDRRVTSLHFYQDVSGLDDIAGNLWIVVKWLGMYCLLLGAGVWIDWASRKGRSGWGLAIIAFVVCGGFFCWRFDRTNWSGMITPLPVVLGLSFVICGVALIRRRSVAALRLALVGFAGVLVAKMGLKAYVYHYGFALALPGTVVLICLVAEELPRWIEQHGGSGRVLRAIGLAAWITAIAAMLRVDNRRWSADTTVVAAGTPDEFRGDDRAAGIVDLCHRVTMFVPPGGSLVVLPQGLMVNYLTRRITPNRTINFMPPEVLAAGEQNVLAGFKAHPPDAIVLTPAVIHDGNFTLDDRDPYGADTLRWVRANYVFVEPGEERRKLQLMLRRK
jgi:hypothetical protein